MIAIIIYSVITILAFLAIILRNQVLLLRGKSFLRFNILFSAVSLLVVIVNEKFAENLTVIWFLLILILISIFLRKKWLLFRYDHLKVSTVIEDSLSKILMSFQKSEHDYTIKSGGGGEVLVHITGFPPKCAILSFKGEVRTKKVEVLQNLLKKSFDGIFPRLVIRLK